MTYTYQQRVHALAPSLSRSFIKPTVSFNRAVLVMTEDGLSEVKSQRLQVIAECIWCLTRIGVRHFGKGISVLE